MNSPTWAEEERDRGGAQEQEHDRARELAEEQRRGIGALLGDQMTGGVAREPGRRLGRRQPGRRRLQAGEELRRGPAPERRRLRLHGLASGWCGGLTRCPGVDEAALDAQQASDPWPGAKHADFAAGEAIGRAVGARVLTFAQGDLVGLTNPLLPPVGPPPVGPGHWIYTPPPLIARGNLGARPFFLTSQDQLRPPPPPAFGSAAFNVALAEVRQISDTRTQEQIDIANYWNVNQSPRSQTAFMGIARELIVSHHRSEAEAARIMFLMSAAAFDALIGCFDAKYHYWFIRPAQADAGIHTVFPTPQHPSYPSAHSCFSGAYSGVLAAAFPSERARVAAVAQEASLSRLYAGIHYRFDFETGLELGRRAAALALAADLDQVAPGTK